MVYLSSKRAPYISIAALRTSLKNTKRVSPSISKKAWGFATVRAWSITPAKLLACEMLLYFGAFRRVTPDTRSVFLFPHFVF